MEFPPDRDPAADAFDFSPGATGLPPDLARQLREAAANLSAMDAEGRRHLAIAMGAVGATWLAPVLAAHRRKRRRRRRTA